MNQIRVIELDEHDDIHSIRDRIATAQSPRVILVVPWDSAVLRKPIDLQIVKRFAAVNQIGVALISSEMEVRTTAHECGLPAFRSVDAARQAAPWPLRPHDDEDELAPWKPSERKRREAQRAAIERDQADAQARKRPPIWRLIKYSLIPVVLIALLVLAVAIIPQADIVFVPRSAQIIANVNVIADPDAESVDTITAHVPAVEVKTTVRDQITVPTTGKKGIPDTRAAGTVIFVNQLNTPVRIGQGTAVRTSATSQAIRFIVTQDVDVPGGIGAQAEGRVEAVEPGFSGDVPANLINEIEGVAALAVRVSNPEPLSGGGEKEVRSVDPADRDTAREQLTKILREDANRQLEANLGQGEFLIPESLSGDILDLTYDHEVTEQADHLTLVMRVEYTALKVASEDTNNLVFTAMVHQAPPNYQLIPQGLSFRRGAAAPVDGSDQLYQFTMQGVGFAAADLDIGRATRQIAGKSIDEARDLLKQALPLRSDPQITVYPGWLPWMPWLSFRIHTEVNPQG